MDEIAVEYGAAETLDPWLGWRRVSLCCVLKPMRHARASRFAPDSEIALEVPQRRAAVRREHQVEIRTTHIPQKLDRRDPGHASLADRCAESKSASFMPTRTAGRKTRADDQTESKTRMCSSKCSTSRHGALSPSVFSRTARIIADVQNSASLLSGSVLIRSCGAETF